MSALDKKKIGLLTNQIYSWSNPNVLAQGGGERVTLQIANLLDRLGYEVHIYQYAPIKFTRKLNNIYVHSLTNTNLCQGCFHIDICNEFYELARDFDKVIIALPEFAGGKMRGDTILITQGIYWCAYFPRGDLTDTQKEYLYRGWAGAGTNIIVHEFTRDAVRELGFDDIADDMICIDNYVDTDVFKPASKRKLILFPGRAEIVKGAGLIEGILDGLDLGDWQAAWCGNGSQFASLKELEKKHPGFSAFSLPMKDAPKAYDEAAICVVINTASRGNSLTLFEGMASGCACIGVEGNNTLIEDSVNGLSCSPNADGISATIERLMMDEKLRERLGARARQDMIENYSVGEWEKKWTKILR